MERFRPQGGRSPPHRGGVRQVVAGHPSDQLRRTRDDHAPQAGSPPARGPAERQPADVDRGPRGARWRRRRDRPRHPDRPPGRLRPRVPVSRVPARAAEGRMPAPWRSQGESGSPREGRPRRRLRGRDRGLRPRADGGPVGQDPRRVPRGREAGDVHGRRARRARGHPGGAADRGPRERYVGRLRADDDRGLRENPESGRAGGGAGDARRPGGIRVMREVAWRLFASEYNDASLEMDGGGERAPSYVITPLGAKVNRIFVVGVITDIENVGSDVQPMWRARVSDPTGTFHVYAGQYQPEAAAALSKLKPPVFGAIVGKSRVYSPDAGTVYTSIRPERIKAVDETVRDFWILEACRSLQKRLDAMGEAQKMDPLTKEGLAKVGVKEAIADGIVQAVNHYGKVDMSRYTAMLAEGLRYLLPEYREPVGPGESIPEPTPAAREEAPSVPDESETKVLEIVATLDKDGKGAPWEGILEAATSKGVSKDSLEESINALLDKGLIYEPILGRMKKI